MFNPTNRLRISSREFSVSFEGFTKARFKTLHVDPFQGVSQDKHFSYTNLMNNQLIDIGDRHVQNALEKCYLRAKSAAEKAANYFEMPSLLHPRKTMKQILTTHFKQTGEPDAVTLRTIRDTFQSAAHGLAGPVTLRDLFAGADRFNENRGLVWGAEGQVAFDPQVDQLYMQVIQDADAEERNDIMRDFLGGSDASEIYLDFKLIRFHTVDSMARIILHEATHKFAHTADYAYFSSNQDVLAMRPEKALLNADSYAYAGISALKDTVVGHNTINQRGGPALALRHQ